MNRTRLAALSTPIQHCTWQPEPVQKGKKKKEMTNRQKKKLNFSADNIIMCIEKSQQIQKGKAILAPKSEFVRVTGHKINIKNGRVGVTAQLV